MLSHAAAADNLEDIKNSDVRCLLPEEITPKYRLARFGNLIGSSVPPLTIAHGGLGVDQAAVDAYAAFNSVARKAGRSLAFFAEDLAAGVMRAAKISSIALTVALKRRGGAGGVGVGGGGGGGGG
eukprot:CAMPEP_0181298902 /NCGR_PEP_ID=MMETSP1101-20121128/6039_1 /TAXON_ID=46948 /ORGANISM="Rhodomonas abbreviata, Strain Caron Lab Isolate" /LENGTH=124 /DNA_ID=CAMNT_0023403973 /DNA_START=730 /DNA_END=1102 /DNA_ORIENTATION=+